MRRVVVLLCICAWVLVPARIAEAHAIVSDTGVIVGAIGIGLGLVALITALMRRRA